jgi:hypothetical protein
VQQVFAQDSSSILNANTTKVTEDSIFLNKDTLVYAVPFLVSDSILQLMDTAVATTLWQESPPSVFTPQQAGRIVTNPSKKQPQWLFVVFLLQLLALVYIKAAGQKNIEDSLKAYFNINLSQQLFREQENMISFSMLVQIINYFFSATVTIYLIIDYYFNIDNAVSLKIASIIFLLVSIIYFIKYSGYKILSEVFPFSEEIDLFRFNFFLNQRLIGIVVIPFVYAAAYSLQPFRFYFLGAIISFFVLSVLFRSYKGIVIGMAYLQKHTFHFLLYICTFEIVPVLILIKWLQTTGYGQN